MSEMSAWGSAFADAPAVPPWTKPASARFIAKPIGTPTGFSAWVSEPAAPSSDLNPAIDNGDAKLAEAYAQGFDEGHRTAFAAIDTEHAAMDRLASAIMNVRAEPPADLARLLSETVSRLVRQVVGEAAAIDTALLAERTNAVAALVTEDGAPARLRLNPADLERIDGLRPDLKLIADLAIPEGSVVAETAQGWVEDGPAIRMEKLRGLLDAMGSRR